MKHRYCRQASQAQVAERPDCFSHDHALH